MKKLGVLFLLVIMINACGGGDAKPGKSGNSDADITKNPDYQKGLTLVAQNKCLTCHSISETVTGPSYQEVANKYAGGPDTIVAHLAHKIIGGGNGVWGEIFMTPHPDLSEADAETMVKYILLLKK
jgi:cytochrome c